MSAFAFDRIPEHLAAGFVPTGPHHEPYVDIDLTAWNVTLPPAPDVPWTALPQYHTQCSQRSTPHTADSLWFRVRRWERGCSERLEYWAVDGGAPRRRANPDFLVALQRGDWYLVVYCLEGHPGFQTPGVDWYNTDGSTYPEPLACASAAELIASAVAFGRGAVEAQIH